MQTIRSFLLEVRDQSGTLLDSFDVPIEAAAFFINPLFTAVAGANATHLREPWYRLVPRRLTTGPLQAPTIPTPALPVAADGTPPLDILADQHDPIKAISVTLYDLDQQLYSADYTTIEVFGAILNYLLRGRIAAGRYPAAVGPFHLRVVPQVQGGDLTVFELVPRDAPVEGVFPIPVPRGPGPRTTFERITRYTYATRTPADLGRVETIKPDLGGRNQLLWRPASYEALTHTQPVSTTVEVGGYLVGQVYQSADSAEVLLVEVQQVLAAHGTRASAALLLFTGDSWSMLRQRLASDLAGLRLLGWWHTHLFPATETFGLSGLDETLHRQFFSSPWHFAALLNVSTEQGRVLRCYQPDEHGVLRECAFSVVSDE